MKHFFKTLAILMLVFTATTSCDDDDNKDSNIITFKATLNGANEVQDPAVETAAYGTATVTFNNTTKMFTLSGTFTNLGSDVIGAHIHGPATTSENAAVIFPLVVTGTTSGTLSLSSTALDATKEGELKAGSYYVNVHSETYDGGEIRGQLIKQ